MPKLPPGENFSLPFLIKQFRESLQTCNVVPRQHRHSPDPTWYQINLAAIIWESYGESGLKRLSRSTKMPEAILKDYALVGSALTPEDRQLFADARYGHLKTAVLCAMDYKAAPYNTPGYWLHLAQERHLSSPALFSLAHRPKMIGEIRAAIKNRSLASPPSSAAPMPPGPPPDWYRSPVSEPADHTARTEAAATKAPAPPPKAPEKPVETPSTSQAPLESPEVVAPPAPPRKPSETPPPLSSASVPIVSASSTLPERLQRALQLVNEADHRAQGFAQEIAAFNAQWSLYYGATLTVVATPLEPGTASGPVVAPVPQEP